MRTILSELKISIMCIGEAIPSWDKDGWTHYKYRVTMIRTPKSGAKPKRVNFEYWGSYADWQNGDPKPTSQVAEAIDSILADVMSYMDSKDIDEFSDEFGYTKPSEAIRAYNGCKSEYKKLTSLGLDESDIVQLHSEVTEVLDA